MTDGGNVALRAPATFQELYIPAVVPSWNTMTWLDASSSLIFFDRSLSGAQVRGFLRAARGERAVDELILRLEARDGAEWLRKGLVQNYGCGEADFIDRLAGGSLDLEALLAIKRASKAAHRETRSDNERTLSLAAYFLSVASGLAWHSACISSQGRDQVDSVLYQLSRALGSPWQALLSKALSSRQYFPATDMKRINAFLDAGAASRPELHRYTMQVYFKPLQVYFRGSEFHFIGEAEEIVASFFSDRIETLYERWLGHREKTGKPIRLSGWLMHTFALFLLEERRRYFKLRGKEQSLDVLEADADSQPTAGAADPRRAYDRAVAIEMVRQAIEDTRKFCSERGNEKQWSAFIARHYLDREYKDIAAELNVREDYARHLVKAGRDRYARIFARFLLGEGVYPEGSEAAIDEMLGLFEDPEDEIS